MENDVRARLVAEALDRPEDRDRIVRESMMDESERAEFDASVEMGDAVWLAAQSVPALEDDRVAKMLGLVPDRGRSLDSSALSRARKRAGLTVGAVAARLRDRGWQFSTDDVFRWEVRSAVDVPPAVIKALADVLGTQVDRLISVSSSGSLPESVGAVRAHPRFVELTARWAAARQVSVSDAAAALEGRLLSTVHRGDHPDVEQLLRSLEVLVAAVEEEGAG